MTCEEELEPYKAANVLLQSQGGFVAAWEGERIDRTTLYMSVAQLFAARSTCRRGQVGCVAVKDNHIVCAGYNGAPSHMDECLDVGCGGSVKVENPDWRQLTPREMILMDHSEIARHQTLKTRIEFPNGCTRAVHAELNMVAFAARYGISLDGCTVYATAGPCLPCAQALVSVRMVALYYEKPYRLPEGLKLVQDAGIPATKYGDAI